MLLQLATIYVPFLQPIFKTEALTLNELLICCALAVTVFFAVEIEKWMVRHWNIYNDPLYESKAL